MKVESLLFVTRFEDLNFDALQSLLQLRRAALNHVVFLNVIDREKVALHRGRGYEKEEEIKLREMANIRFIDWAETLFEQGLEVGVYIVVGTTIQQVVASAGKERVDLIVMSHQKKSRLETLYSGEELSEIVQRAQIPVLIYKYVSTLGEAIEAPFARPLFTTAWSETDSQVMSFLLHQKAVIEEVHVVHVADDKSLTGGSAMTIQSTRKNARQKLDRLCEALEAEGLRVRPHVYVGDPVTEIEKAGRECQATLLMVGTSRRSSWRERWVGSIPVGLAEKSHLPLLVFPAGKGE